MASSAPRPQDIRELDDVRVWASYQQAQREAWWQAQREWNATVETRLSRDKSHLFTELAKLEDRVSKLERRVIWAAGAMAGIGGLAGGVLAVLAQLGTSL